MNPKVGTVGLLICSILVEFGVLVATVNGRRDQKSFSDGELVISVVVVLAFDGFGGVVSIFVQRGVVGIPVRGTISCRKVGIIF